MSSYFLCRWSDHMTRGIKCASWIHAVLTTFYFSFFHQCGSAPQRPAVRHQRQQGRFRAECCGGNPGGFQGIRSGWRYLQGTCKPASLAYIAGIASHFDTCCLADTSDHSGLQLLLIYIVHIYYFLWLCGLKGIWNVMTFCSLLVRLYVFTKYN